MSLTAAGKALALGPLSATTLSYHTGAAGDDGGANEASGGGYTRKACSFSAAADGARSLAADVLMDLPAGTFTHYGLWIGATCIDTGALISQKVLAEAGQVNNTVGSITLT
jgi:hypothetical protein